ncbi:MAG: prephenate dehydrogenase [Nanoarchaeota archaeon]|nr:prephenate dehydrogenase [Nanoarchaeota archaeon]MBU4300306.1 prephenate dehydrogenase [Nanoarchaeota archaeon]MBU4452047.1 prephenate dehydrogenase [Nanoarchaeota archaeon]MCG2723186.1 prephenate dehydrogenase [archaeon]
MEIGVIGTGDMGKRYAKVFDKAGYRVNCCDLPQNTKKLEEDFNGTGINILSDGVAVSSRSDLIFYLVPTESIEETVAKYGPSTKKNAIVSSGTSVMTPSINAFEKYMPEDVNIINWHWLFGPSINPKGQPTVLVNYRSSDEAYEEAKKAFESIGTNLIELSCQEHDKITADTQVVTHVGFEAMGTAWKNVGVYPWENPSYVGGIDNVKVLMCLRIYSGKPHVYSGLAILNPYAREQVKQYAVSESELFKLMIKENAQEFTDRIKKAGEYVFGHDNTPILLDEAIMREFGLGLSSENKMPNSHLSLLSMVDAWYQLKTNPYENMICQTPPFRLRLGIVEHLFKNPDLLKESLDAALYNKEIRGDDLEFHTAVREWATIIGNGDTKGYQNQFDTTKAFFKNRLEEGMKKSGDLIKKLNKKS